MYVGCPGTGTISTWQLWKTGKRFKKEKQVWPKALTNYAQTVCCTIKTNILQCFNAKCALAHSNW